MLPSIKCLSADSGNESLTFLRIRPSKSNSIVLPTGQKKKTVCVCQGPNGGITEAYFRSISSFSPGAGHRNRSTQAAAPRSSRSSPSSSASPPATSPKPKKPKKNKSKKDLKNDGALALVGDDLADEDFEKSDIDKLIDWSIASPCPYPSLACPIFSSPENRDQGIASDFECVDPSADLDNCGGCSSFEDSHKCPAAISARSLGANAGRGLASHGVKQSMCVEGECHIASCQCGYKIDTYYDEGFNKSTIPSATTTPGGTLVGRALQGKWKQRCVPSSH
ncbi:hypothetical protein FRC01_010420 [Tulasnella sp. 417]|nr:hypothetical protein FRC01_010420 [Tulasnella sp. 417]